MDTVGCIRGLGHQAWGIPRGPDSISVNRLGNLVLLPSGVNSKFGNRDITFKKAKYRQTGPLLLLGSVLIGRDGGSPGSPEIECGIDQERLPCVFRLIGRDVNP